MSRLAAVLAAPVTAAVTAATVSGLTARALDTRLADRPGWQLTNYRGRGVSLTAGPALVAGAVSGAVAGAFADPGGDGPAGVRWRLAATVAAGAGAAALGRLDDLGHGEPKGLRGHLAAARQGRLTRGAVKLVGLPAVGLAAAWLHPCGPSRMRSRLLRDAALVAASANVVNLLDVRPGRALKVTGLLAAPALSGARPSPLVGACGALLAADLGERRALGDCGANAAGALLGLGLLDRLGPRGRDRALATVVLLTLVSERVPLSSVIDAVPALRALDRWGRVSDETPAARRSVPSGTPGDAASAGGTKTAVH